MNYLLEKQAKVTAKKRLAIPVGIIQKVHSKILQIKRVISRTFIGAKNIRRK